MSVPGGQVGFESQFDEDLASALHDFMSKARVRTRWGVIDDLVREVINRPPPPPKQSDLDQILANMERWRWVPADLGRLHIWNNLPEYMTRVVKDGSIIHEERIIIGQPDTQTPVFSAPMRQVVFQPEWGVPPSIKINDLLPKLQDGDFEVLNRRDMRILSMKGKELNPERFNWDKVDIRDVGIYQRAGDANPLGLVKFLFPNKHHVYMHDTNNRALFKHNERTFSHGCIRVRDPQKFAELILGEDQGWDKKKVEKNLLDPAFGRWLDGMWERLRAALLQAARDPDRAFAGQFGASLSELGGALESDQRLQLLVNRFVRRTVTGTVTRYGDEIVRLVSETVRRWDARTVTERIEAAVGRDLQFIRINGTLVGGLVGLCSIESTSCSEKPGWPAVLQPMDPPADRLQRATHELFEER